jgi:cysteine desulfurase/selenocysteine lyase
MRRNCSPMRDRPRNLLVCLDNAATTQNPQAVMDRVTHFYANENSNIYWATHALAERATKNE